MEEGNKYNKEINNWANRRLNNAHTDVFTNVKQPDGTFDLGHVPYEDWKKHQTEKTKDSIIKYKNRRSTKGANNMAGKSGSIFDDIEDSTDEIGYILSNNKKGFARDVAEKYNPSSFSATKHRAGVTKDIREDIKRNKERPANAYKTETKTRDIYDAEKLKSTFKAEQVENAFKNKYLKNHAENIGKDISEDNKQIFGNIRNYKKNIEQGKAESKKVKKIYDGLYDSNDDALGQYSYFSNPLYDEKETNKKFNKAFRKIVVDARSETDKNHAEAFNSVKTNYTAKHKKWNDRANMASGNENDREYYTGSGGKRSKAYYGADFKDPHEIMKNYGFDSTGFTTKKEVDKAKRKIAAKLHPDVNKAEDATSQMQKAMDDMDNVKNTSWYSKLAYMMQQAMEKTAAAKIGCTNSRCSRYNSETCVDCKHRQK